MLPLDVFDYTNIRDLLAAWLARQPEGGRNTRARWLAKQLGCERTQILNLKRGSRKVQLPSVAVLGRALGVEGEALEYVRTLVALHEATSREFKALHLSMWAAHAAKKGIPAAEVAALVAHKPVPGSQEGALLALLPLLCDLGSPPAAPELEALFCSPPEPGYVAVALDLARRGLTVGEQRSGRLLTLSGPGSPDTWSGVAWHGLYELAREALMAVPAEERDFQTRIWSVDGVASDNIAKETAELGRWLAGHVARHAQKRDGRLHLLMVEQTALSEILRSPTDRPLVETAQPPLPRRTARANVEVQRPDPQPEGRPCIYLYLEFSPFARAWVEWRERMGEPHSYSWLGDRMGTGRSLAYDLVTGGAQLKPHHVAGLARALELKKDEESYLEGMARLSISTDLLERARERQALIAFAIERGVRTLEGDAFRVSSHWSPLAIHALAFLPVFRDNPAWISCALRGRICWQDVRDMVASMVSVGMLQPQAGGPLRPQAVVQRGFEDFRGVALFAAQDSVLKMLQTELQFPTPEQRLRAWAFLLPDSARPALKARVNTHEARVHAHLLASDTRAATSPQDRVLLSALQLFPLSVPMSTAMVPRAPRR